MQPSGHHDDFARKHLPPPSDWPDFLLSSADFAYPPRLNCVTRLLDDHIAQGHGDAPCLLDAMTSWSYAQTQSQVNKIATILTRDFGLKSGNRVLLRAPNSPMMVAAYLAVMKAGGIVVATVPMLRTQELIFPLQKAEITLALCDHRLTEDLQVAQLEAPKLRRIITFGAPHAQLETLMREASDSFTAADTAIDDVCLFGFTSGTTGVPKCTMHFHRDVLAIADGYGKHILKATHKDRFIGSPPLAFTFGLGGLVVFPLAVGASSILLERAPPPDLLNAIKMLKPTVVFTAPTAYKVMAGLAQKDDLSSLTTCVSAGETLPQAIFDIWKAKTGLPLMDGIGATELLHIFISAEREKIRPGATGLPVPGYEAKIMGPDDKEVPRGTSGLLAVRGPTGCRYLDDERQKTYVRHGWNYTGDVYLQDEDGYFWYQARSDDMIISAGYNIAGPEVEAALMRHAGVAECAVIGVPDDERGMVVKAFVVPAHGYAPTDALVKTLQDHVKATIAPFKYPRLIEFRDSLPKTPTGKLQRSALRSRTGGNTP